MKTDRVSPPSLRSRPKSPARPKSPSRAAKNPSPARAKAASPARVVKSPPSAKSEAKASPPASSTPKPTALKARSPIRKSPSRKSPSRKSPTRGVVKPEVKKSELPRIVTRSRVDLDGDSDGGDVAPVKPQATVRGRARYFEEQEETMAPVQPEPVRTNSASTLNLIKRVTRNSQSREVERIVQVKHYESAKKLGEFSDDEQRDRKSIEKPSLTTVTEFGGLFGTFLLVTGFPIFIVWLGLACNETQCSFVKLPDLRKLTLVSTYFHLKSALGVLAFATSLAFLSILPFGGRRIQGLPTKQGRFTYNMNGFFSLIVFLSIGVGLEVRGINIFNFIYNHTFHIAVASYLLGLVLSFYVYIRSFYVPLSALNVHVLNKGSVYGFFLGREITPRIFGILDLKMYVNRFALIGSILYIAAILYRSLGQPLDLELKSLHIHPTLLILSVCQIIYVGDALLFETSWVTSLEIQYEGFGYMSSTGYLSFPFLMVTVNKYVLDHNVNLPEWQLIALSLVFVCGYILFRGSNNQKDAFRKNPYDPALSHLETIPTSKGKKLLCSGFWGIVRHPNYLGDILMNLTFGFFAPTVPPIAPFLSIVVLLVHRSVRDNTRCKIKYGAAWDRYCNRVRNVLVPKVY